MWEFLTWINGHNCDRPAKKVSAILSRENTKKANIEAQLKKIEVISSALFFALLIEGMIFFIVWYVHLLSLSISHILIETWVTDNN